MIISSWPDVLDASQSQMGESDIGPYPGALGNWALSSLDVALSSPYE
jgi:hypothetical protein